MRKRVELRDEMDHSIVFDGQAGLELLEGGGLVITMEQDQTRTIWKIFKRGIVIENVHQLKTILTLFEQGRSKARIFSPYGEMEAPISGVSIDKQVHNVQVSYTLADDQTFQFRLSCAEYDFINPTEME